MLNVRGEPCLFDVSIRVSCNIQWYLRAYSLFLQFYLADTFYPIGKATCLLLGKWTIDLVVINTCSSSSSLHLRDSNIMTQDNKIVLGYVFSGNGHSHFHYYCHNLSCFDVTPLISSEMYVICGLALPDLLKYWWAFGHFYYQMICNYFTMNDWSLVTII